jgi:hypothetical protein
MLENAGQEPRAINCEHELNSFCAIIDFFQNYYENDKDGNSIGFGVSKKILVVTVEK